MGRIGRKYEFTDIQHRYFKDAYRIRALVDLPKHNVRAGDIGGFITGEHNLSQHGESWVGDDALVIKNGLVTDDAYAGDYTRLTGRALLMDDACAVDHATMCGETRACGYAQLSGTSLVCDNAQFFDHVRVSDDATVEGNVTMHGNSQVYADARMSGDVQLRSHMAVGCGATITHPEHILHMVLYVHEPCEVTLYRTTTGADVTVGEWEFTFTLDEFRSMIEAGRFVGAGPETVKRRAPELLAFVAMCEARVADWRDTPVGVENAYV